MNSNNSTDPTPKKNFHSSEYAGHLLTRMEELRKSNKLSDVELMAGENGKKIPAHRFILAAASAYFSTMFASSMREATEHEITIKGVSANTLENIVEFCYTGSLELQKDNVEELFCAAHLLQFDMIVKACEEFLDNHLGPMNCLSFYILAEQRDCTKLLEKAIQCVCKYYEEICKSQEFLQLSAEQLCTLLNRDDIIVSEEIVFKSLLLWLEYDRENRQNYISKIMPLIRMTLLEPIFIENVVEPICTTVECQKILMNAFKWHANNERQSVKRLVELQPKTEEKLDKFVILTVKPNAITFGEAYYPTLNKWVTMALERKTKTFRIQAVFLIHRSVYFIRGTLPEENCDKNFIEDFSIAVLENNLYVIGGSVNGMGVSADVQRYYFHEGRSVKVHRMITERRELCAAVIGYRIYAIGGRNATGVLNSVECYDNISWKTKCSMNTQRMRAAVGVLNNFIYVFGGNDGCKRLSSIEQYDEKLNKWSTIYNMTDARDSLGCVLFENKFFLIGGVNNAGNMVATVETYDPKNMVMAKMKDMQQPQLGRNSILMPNELINKFINTISYKYIDISTP